MIWSDQLALLIHWWDLYAWHATTRRILYAIISFLAPVRLVAITAVVLPVITVTSIIHVDLIILRMRGPRAE